MTSATGCGTNIPTEFGGDKLLVIHTDRSGEVSKKDLDVARKVAREVDDDESPVNASSAC